jgi:hypothetical protein
LKLWEIVHPLVGEYSYVIDFGYFPKTNKCIVIEISPFLPCTGPALFNWKNDKHILENGPLEFRLSQTCRAGIEELIESNWEQRWKEKPPKFARLLVLIL